MGVITTSEHEFWATVSGDTLEELTRQQELLWNWGVSAVELRADLIPPDIFRLLLAKKKWKGPTLVAHFGTGSRSGLAWDTALAAIENNIDGVICHSRCEVAREIKSACGQAGKFFAAAYHAQSPMTLSEAEEEFEQQETFAPLFRKIAIRANTFEDALALLEATYRISTRGGSPVVAAIFGHHRWARIALPHAGSAISFVVAHQVSNEEGQDDEQLQIGELDDLLKIRGMLRGKDRPAMNIF